MNKDEIKKALECCSNPSINYCKDCPYNKNGEFSCCNGVMCKDTLDLVTKQENEIEYRKKQYDNQIAENTRLHIEYDKAFERLTAQQREIDRLKIQLEQANARIENCRGCELEETKAVKEFAGKLKEKALSHCRVINCYELTFIETTIDDLLKEYEK